MRCPPLVWVFVLVALAATTSCKPTAEKKEESGTTVSGEHEGKLLQVGSFVIYQSDLDHHLNERFGGRRNDGTRKQALDELVDRARFAQAALDAGMDQDPVVRAETARILSNRLKQTILNPLLKETRESIAETRLREIYEVQQDRFVSKEKRQIAVLWLNAGVDPAREKQYREKLTQARDWFFNDSDLKDHPDKGFSVVAVDHSEHAASRFKGGEVGWFERDGGSSAWSRAVAEIGFSLGEIGEVSPVITRPEGVFLVRLMADKPPVQRSFESVRDELEKEEQRRLRLQLETEFRQELARKYPSL